MTPERLTAIAARLDDLEQQRIEVLIALGDELLASGYVSGSWMRDGSGIEPDSAAVLEAAEGAGEEAIRSLPTSPAAPPSRPAFDPLGPAPALTCPECERPAKNANGLAIHRARMHGVKGAAVQRSHEQRDAYKAAHPRGTRPLITEGDPTEPNGHDFKAKPIGIEWFLCNACPVQYTTRLRLDEHRARAHPAVPSGKPVGSRARSEVDRVLHPGRSV